MSLEAMLAEYDQEMAGTRRVLSAIPGDAMGFRPHERSWTMGELATHVANVPTWLLMTLRTAELDLAQPMERPAVPANPGELVERFDAAVAEGRRALAAATPDSLVEPWTLRNGERIRFTLPRASVIRSTILNHMIHHRGQLTVYLRLTGASIPGLYGPSGDEM